VVTSTGTHPTRSARAKNELRGLLANDVAQLLAITSRGNRYPAGAGETDLAMIIALASLQRTRSANATAPLNRPGESGGSIS